MVTLSAKAAPSISASGARRESGDSRRRQTADKIPDDPRNTLNRALWEKILREDDAVFRALAKM
jgi:hypothetical protein